MARKLRAGLSYALDWAIVICFAAAGGVLTYIPGFHRPFSLTDTEFAYPFKPDIVSLPVVAIVSLFGPAAVIVMVNLGKLMLTRFRTTARNDSSTKLRFYAFMWQTHASLLGLCVGLAATLFLTAGLKDIVGKPRPNMLARCQPDLTNIDRYIVGGFGMNLDSEPAPFVTSAICLQQDKRLLDDSFASFPSGHASFNSAGMVYLTLWLCARFHIGMLGHEERNEEGSKSTKKSNAAPALWRVVLGALPIGVALFVCASRYADYHHAGFDIIAGAALGSSLGWVAFRMYHGKVNRFGGDTALRARGLHPAINEHERVGGDVEQARYSLGTELSHLRSTGPARINTADSTQPILIPSNAAVLPQSGRMI